MSRLIDQCRPSRDGSRRDPADPSTSPGVPLRPSPHAPTPWRVIEDDISVFCACNLPASGVDARITPNVGICDGSLDLMLVRGRVTRWQLLQVFMALDAGTHIQLPFVEVIKATELVLQPLDPVYHVNVSGEREFPSVCPVLHLSVMHSLARFDQ